MTAKKTCYTTLVSLDLLGCQSGLLSEDGFLLRQSAVRTSVMSPIVRQAVKTKFVAFRLKYIKNEIRVLILFNKCCVFLQQRN
jgi:hypothetical protein